MSLSAPIFKTVDQFVALKSKLVGNCVLGATSCPADPPHVGHVSVLQDIKRYCDKLVVIVNGDNFLKRKKGKAFMDAENRCEVIAAMKGVDYVVLFETDEDNEDQTVIEPLYKIRPDIFGKGGDRVDEKTIPEWEICKELGIQIITGLGKPKIHSSSEFLKAWAEFMNNKEKCV